MEHLKQSGYRVKLEWGKEGLEALAAPDTVTILIDILSFTTCVSVAMDRGAEVYPYRFKDESAVGYAATLGAFLAGSRKEKSGFSLSPASLARLDAGDRIVLPSPNGSALSLAATGKHVLAGSFRNCRAVADFVNRLGSDVAIIAAGERWPNGSIRFAAEDFLGAGALISLLQGSLSPEAEMAAEAYGKAKPRLEERIRDTVSGRELIGWGYGEDVRMACETEASAHVPVLAGNRYARATAA